MSDTTPVGRYSVRVGGERLLFSSGHFISFAGHRCERLHGHNYRAEVVVEGPLTTDHYVIDFIALTRLAKVITDSLDHRMLVATRNPVVSVEWKGGEVLLRYAERRWVFPEDDCALLDIENTTAELLAKYVAENLLSALAAEGFARPDALSVSVEEGVGVWGAYRV